MKVSSRTSRQWFEEAVKCYAERHQGCPWCGGSHRVYRLIRGQQETFTCQGCDFQAGYDEATGKYSHIVGEDPQSKDPAFEF